MENHLVRNGIITNYQLDNLKILSDGLLGFIDPVIKVNADFSMMMFSEHRLSFSEEEDSFTECGSVGCAVGWAPFFGINKTSNETWVDFSRRCFVSTSYYFKRPEIPTIQSQRDLIWNFMFASGWEDIDNTKEGAGLRITYAIQYGIPESFREDDDENIYCDDLEYLKLEKFSIHFPFSKDEIKVFEVFSKSFDDAVVYRLGNLLDKENGELKRNEEGRYTIGGIGLYESNELALKSITE